MRVTGRASVRDLFWNFARAEFEVPARGPRHTQPEIPGELKERILRGERAGLSRYDWGLLREALISTRASIVNPVLAYVRTWSLAEIEAADLADLRVMNLRIFTSIAPSRKLLDLAASLVRGIFPEIWDPGHYRELRAGFDWDRMRGRPILLSERTGGPWTLVEGTTRLCVIASRQNRGELRFDSFPVLLGVGAKLGEWEWF